MVPIVFKDDMELMHFAHKYIVKDRLNSLENDVNRWLPTAKIEAAEYAPAPFPALLYCFSIVAPFAGMVGGGFLIGLTTGYAIKKVIKSAAVIGGLFIAV